MKRELRFRGWHTSANKMFSAEEMAKDQLTLLTTGSFINVSGADTSLSVVYDREKFIPLQFTGLHDRHGKEIYEGDIISDPNNFGCITGWGGGECDEFPDKKLIAWDETDAKFKLDFLNEAYRGRGVSGYSLCKGNCTSRFEVIGNIHQHPELLKL
jgi:hypothetical protein